MIRDTLTRFFLRFFIRWSSETRLRYLRRKFLSPDWQPAELETAAATTMTADTHSGLP